MQRVAVLSIDLDEIPNYHAIHGLPAPSEVEGRHAVYERALERAQAFARANALPLTLFAIGADLERGENATRVASLSREGHAVENHSLSHLYDLSRRTPGVIRAEIAGGADAIERAVGRRPIAFRAPGYTMSPAVYRVLEELGVGVDSSSFPCPAYWAAKAAVLAGYALARRPSRSIFGSPRAALGPRGPHRVGNVLELPIAVTPGLRLPLLGTLIGRGGPAVARRMVRACGDDELLVVELHGIDFLEVSDGLGALRGLQPELGAPLGRRLEALTAVVDEARTRGFDWVTLEEVARSRSATTPG